jgi:hypothetical protein
MIPIHEFVNGNCRVTNRFQQNVFGYEINGLRSIADILVWIKQTAGEAFLSASQMRKKTEVRQPFCGKVHARLAA